VFWKFHTHDDIVNLARDLERELNKNMELMNSGKESETPRTDAVFWKFHTHDDIVNLARDLERENQKLRARLNQVQGCDCDNYLQTYCDKHNPHINP
jgi:hypothetical protein